MIKAVHPRPTGRFARLAVRRAAIAAANSFYRNFGCRRTADLSAARAFGVSARTISNWRNGR